MADLPGGRFTRARRAIMGATIVAWLVVCGLVYRGLILHVRAAPEGTIEEYARAPGFQALNFAAGYLPGLALLLFVALAVEWLLFRAISRVAR